MSASEPELGAGGSTAHLPRVLPLIARPRRRKDGSQREEFLAALAKGLPKALCELRLIPAKELERLTKDRYPIRSFARTMLQRGAYKREP